MQILSMERLLKMRRQFLSYEGAVNLCCVKCE